MLVLQAVTQAQVAQTTDFVREILMLLIQGIGTVLLGLLTFVAKSAWSYLKEKKKIDVNDAVKKSVDEAITKGVARAQEWGLKTLVPDPSDTSKAVPVTGEMKKQVAVDTAVKIEPEFAKLTPDVQAALVDAKLQMMRPQFSMPPPASDLATALGGKSVSPPPVMPSFELTGSRLYQPPRTP